MTPEATTAIAELEAALEQGMAEMHVPGAAVGVIVDGAEHIICRGVTNAHHPLPVTAETIFQVGSTTKTLTATAVMRLVEQGRLALDQPVRSSLPEFRLAEDDVA